MDELLMERYALAKERVCEIKEEKAVQMPYLDFFQKTAAFLEKNVEIMDGVVFLGEAREPKKLADAADLSIDEWKELNRDLYADILPENYRNSYGNPVYACEKEAGTLLDPSANLSGYGNRSCSLKADILLEDLQAFEAAGFSVQMLHTPGHTPGSCCYYLKDEGILFSGDTLFYGSVGRTDFPGGSSAEIVRSLHKLVDTLPEDTEVFPGHDASTTIGYEKRYNPFV